MAERREVLENLLDITSKEVKETIADGKINEPKLSVLYKAVEVWDHADKILKRDQGYSEEMWNYPRARRGRDGDGDGDGRYNERMPYMNGMPYDRGSYGNYGNNMYGNPYGNPYGNQYDNSYDNDGMRQKLEKLMQKAQTEQDREEIRNMIRQLER